MLKKIIVIGLAIVIIIPTIAIATDADGTYNWFRDVMYKDKENLYELEDNDDRKAMREVMKGSPKEVSELLKDFSLDLKSSTKAGSTPEPVPVTPETPPPTSGNSDDTGTGTGGTGGDSTGGGNNGGDNGGGTSNNNSGAKPRYEEHLVN